MKLCATSIAAAVALVMAIQAQSAQARDSWFDRNKDQNAGPIKVESVLHDKILHATHPRIANQQPPPEPVYTSSIGHGTYPFLTHPVTSVSVAEETAVGSSEPLATVLPSKTADEPYFKYEIVTDENPHQPASKQADNVIEMVEEELDKEDNDHEENDDDDDDEEDEDDGENGDNKGKDVHKFHILPVLKNVVRALRVDDYEAEIEDEFEDMTESNYIMDPHSFDYDAEYMEEVVGDMETKNQSDEGDEKSRVHCASLLNRILHPFVNRHPDPSDDVEEMAIEIESVPDHELIKETKEKKGKKEKKQKDARHYDHLAEIIAASDSVAEAILSAIEPARRALGAHGQSIEEKLTHQAEQILHDTQAAVDRLTDKDKEQDKVIDKFHETKQKVNQATSSASKSLHDSNEDILNAAAQSSQDTEEAINRASSVARKSIHQTQKEIAKEAKANYDYRYHRSSEPDKSWYKHTLSRDIHDSLRDSGDTANEHTASVENAIREKQDGISKIAKENYDFIAGSPEPASNSWFGKKKSTLTGDIVDSVHSTEETVKQASSAAQKSFHKSEDNVMQAAAAARKSIQDKEEELIKIAKSILKYLQNIYNNEDAQGQLAKQIKDNFDYVTGSPEPVSKSWFDLKPKKRTLTGDINDSLRETDEAIQKDAFTACKFLLDTKDEMAKAAKRDIEHLQSDSDKITKIVKELINEATNPKQWSAETEKTRTFFDDALDSLHDPHVNANKHVAAIQKSVQDAQAQLTKQIKENHGYVTGSSEPESKSWFGKKSKKRILTGDKNDSIREADKAIQKAASAARKSVLDTEEELVKIAKRNLEYLQNDRDKITKMVKKMLKETGNSKSWFDKSKKTQSPFNDAIDSFHKAQEAANKHATVIQKSVEDAQVQIAKQLKENYDYITARVKFIGKKTKKRTLYGDISDSVKETDEAIQKATSAARKSIQDTEEELINIAKRKFEYLQGIGKKKAKKTKKAAKKASKKAPKKEHTFFGDAADSLRKAQDKVYHVTSSSQKSVHETEEQIIKQAKENLDYLTGANVKSASWFPFIKNKNSNNIKKTVRRAQEEIARRAKENYEYLIGAPEQASNSWFNFGKKKRSLAGDAAEALHSTHDIILNAASVAQKSVHDTHEAALKHAKENLEYLQDTFARAADEARKQSSNSPVVAETTFNDAKLAVQSTLERRAEESRRHLEQLTADAQIAAVEAEKAADEARVMAEKKAQEVQMLLDQQAKVVEKSASKQYVQSELDIAATEATKQAQKLRDEAEVRLEAAKKEINKRALELEAAAKKHALEIEEAAHLATEKIAAFKIASTLKDKLLKQDTDRSEEEKQSLIREAAEKLAAANIDAERVVAEKIAQKKFLEEQKQAAKEYSQKVKNEEWEKSQAVKAFKKRAEKEEADREAAEKAEAARMAALKKKNDKEEAKRLAAEKAALAKLEARLKKEAAAKAAEEKKIADAKLVQEKKDFDKRESEARKLADKLAKIEAVAKKRRDYEQSMIDKEIAAKKQALQSKIDAEAKAYQSRLDAENKKHQAAIKAAQDKIAAEEKVAKAKREAAEKTAEQEVKKQVQIDRKAAEKTAKKEAAEVKKRQKELAKRETELAKAAKAKAEAKRLAHDALLKAELAEQAAKAA
ncbi:hypothetical protein FBU30_003555 [Linnemannia zychae]|nr:hypothetical protein FBU30_003555 [Linnemannia zychae]